MSAPLKIVHVLTTLDVGGAEMHVLAQVRGQTERGHAVRVLYLKGQGTLAADLRAAGAEHVEHIAPAAFVWRARTHLRWADIVHSHLLKADMLTALCVIPWGRASHLVASKHNDEQVLRKKLVGVVHGLLGRVARRTIVLSEHVARFVAEHGRLPRARLTQIYYGLDPRPFELSGAARAEARRVVRAELGIPENAFVFTCVARFAAQKAHGDLLAGFACARAVTLNIAQSVAQHPRLSASTAPRPLVLLLVGDDPFGDGRERAEQRAAELQLGASAIFTGIRRDVPRVLAASDVFVMTSLWEGLGLVFLESMASGIPVLATRVSAVPEVVEDERTGLLVPPGDQARISEAMLRLAGDPELCARLGAAGRARVLEKFALPRMIDATLAVYREVLSGR